jgi:hypothetical protein
LFFVAGLVWAAQNAPELASTVSFAPLLLLLLLSAPAGTILNAIELHSLSRIAGGAMTWRTAVELTLYTSAANMLPIPGGAVTKIAGMRSHGIGYGAASAMVLLSFGVWGALAFLYSGTALLLLGANAVAIACLGFGAVLLGASAIGFAKFKNWPLVGVVAATRLASFVLEAIRYMLALAAFGIAVGFTQSSALVVASFVGAAVVIAPQGLGVSEAVAALLATFVGLSAAAGFIASAVGRVARLVGLAIMAGGLLLAQRAGAALPRTLHSGSR